MASLSTSQIDTLAIVERVATVPSLIGIAFIMATYLLCKDFNKPINRLVFFASIGNLGMNIATLISMNGLLSGQNSALCQIQAFLIQQFLGVDALWVSCMAFNVHLAIFRGFTVAQLRALDKYYLVICYPLAFIPALVYVFVSTEGRGRVYGPAVVWCWINIKWDFLRFLTLYGIVWFAMFATTIIYVRAFRVIWRKRKECAGFFNPLNENPLFHTVTHEVHITHEDRTEDNHRDPVTGTDLHGNTGYSWEVVVERREEGPREPTILQMSAISREVAQKEPNADAWLYARIAFLFFISILLTWIPSSVNRVYSLARPDAINFPLNLTSAAVFPLQGFWNLIVYIITSQAACKTLWTVLRGSLPFGNRRRGSASGVLKDIQLRRFHQRRRSHRLDSDVTSVTSLARTTG